MGGVRTPLMRDSTALDRKPGSETFVGMKSIFKVLLCTVAPFTAVAEEGGFLFATFKGENNPMTEQVYFGLSRDGREWRALKGGEPVLVSALGEKGVRDPFLIRSHDGKRAWIIATDLSVHLRRHDWPGAVKEGSHAVIIWESEDLVDWGEPRRVEVAPEDAGCTWAPEAIYDEERGDYMLFWASTTGRDKYEKHRIWAARTRDFKDFGEPFIYIERERAVIDTDIVFEGGSYYRFSKDETTKATTMEKSDTLMGEWEEMEGFSLSGLRGYEGPACFLLEEGEGDEPGTWCLLLDHYRESGGYKPFITDDLASGEFRKAEDISFPFRFRHGSVLPVSEEEYQRLDKAFGGEG